MGFSCYTDFGVPQYGDLGPPEPWYISTIRKQGELIGNLQGRVSELERTLEGVFRQIDRQAEVIECLRRDYKRI